MFYSEVTVLNKGQKVCNLDLDHEVRNGQFAIMKLYDEHAYLRKYKN